MSLESAARQDQSQGMAESSKLLSLLRTGIERSALVRDREGVHILEQALALAAGADRHIAWQDHRIAQLESLLATDELTGLLNRRGLLEQLRRMLASAERAESRGVIAYLDLDNFKTINDRFGHAAGDATLVRVAEILAANTRTADIVGRIGGDEFVVVFVDAGWRWGQVRAQQIHRMVNRAFACVGEHRVPLRASIGVQVYQKGDTADDLLRRADEAMYLHKRDRVTIVHIATAKGNPPESDMPLPLAR